MVWEWLDLHDYQLCCWSLRNSSNQSGNESHLFWLADSTRVIQHACHLQTHNGCWKKAALAAHLVFPAGERAPHNRNNMLHIFVGFAELLFITFYLLVVIIKTFDIVNKRAVQLPHVAVCLLATQVTAVQQTRMELGVIKRERLPYNLFLSNWKHLSVAWDN